MVNISNTIDLTLYDSLSGTLLITNPMGKVLYTNKAIEKRTGYSVAEVVGKRPGDLWGGNMCDNFYVDFWSTIKDKKKPFITDVCNKKKDGKSMHEQLHVAPILNADGGIQYYIEMQPDYRKKKGKKDFDKDFLNIFYNQNKYGVQLVEWIFTSLSCEDSGKDRVKEYIKRAKREKETLPIYLYNSFIFPIKKKFKLREEDEKLVLAAKDDPKEFWVLYKKYKDDVLYYFSRRLIDRDDIAEELMQETFLRALKYISTFSSTNASYRTYLLRIAHNLLVNYYRQTRMVSFDDISEAFLSYHSDFGDILESDRLLHARLQLSEAEQAILRMKYDEGMKVREISIILQKSENAVKLHLSRGRKKLRDYLA